MKTQIIIILILLTGYSSYAQYDYAPSKEYPFGRPNPEAPKQIKDFEPMIGRSQCKSMNRKPDGTWADPVDMTWTFAYIMNGMGVQDKTLKSDGKHTGSIRQYDADSTKWFVHYYSSAAPSSAPLSYWTGNNEGDKIVLFKDQTSPQGYAGFSRLTFYEFTEDGYKWIGEWIDVNQTIVYPFWKIECKRE